jgi:hypothetical protein
LENRPGSSWVPSQKPRVIKPSRDDVADQELITASGPALPDVGQLSSIRQEYHTSEAQRCRTEPREKTTQIFEAM